MVSLGYFTCSYARQEDVEQASPCGRRATRRRGEPKCVGHWVVSWLLARFGVTEQARKTWSFYMWIALVYFALSTVSAARDAHAPPLKLALLVLCTFYMGSLLLAVYGEKAFGGVISLVVGLPAGTLSIALGVEELLSSAAQGSHRSGHISQLLGVFTGFSDAAVGLVITAGWLSFVLQYLERQRLADIAILLSNLAFIGLVITAIALVVFSHGSEADPLTWVLMIGGAALVAGGLNFLKKLVERLRV